MQAGSRVVILLHGFPEIWYTWRHQMVGLANGGFRAIAPDFRGYGLSDKPTFPQTASFKDLVFDLLGIVDHLDISKVPLLLSSHVLFQLNQTYRDNVVCNTVNPAS